MAVCVCVLGVAGQKNSACAGSVRAGELSMSQCNPHYSRVAACCAMLCVAWRALSLCCRAWVALVGLEAAQRQMSVCIGSTSARACNTAGLTKVIYPDSPSIDSWVECVLQALQQLQKQPVSAA